MHGILALRSGANFSSSAGFDGFAKENAATASTITFRKSRFRVSVCATVAIAIVVPADRAIGSASAGGL
jgi:hypothetical protein